MQVICVAQQKGGVGKTTVARLLCEHFARAGRSTLGIDMDQQCNLSARFLSMEQHSELGDGFVPPVHPELASNPEAGDGRSSVADLFMGGEALPYATSIPNLDILPGFSQKLSTIELVDKAHVKERIYDRMAEALDGNGEHLRHCCHRHASESRSAGDFGIEGRAPRRAPNGDGASGY